jgi:hypothetical protein
LESAFAHAFVINSLLGLLMRMQLCVISVRRYSEDGNG